MTENEKQEAFDRWYDENYDEWAEGEEGIALREELEQAFKSGIAELEKENAELKEALKNDKVCKCSHYLNFKDLEKQLTKAKEILKEFVQHYKAKTIYIENMQDLLEQAEQFLNSEVEKCGQ